MRFSVFQLSRKGGRKNNEDRMGYCYTRDAVMFVLADGMGGHPEGEVAAQLALQTASSVFQQEARPTVADPQKFLVSALMISHQQIIKYATDKGMLNTPRTTLVLCLVQDNQAHWIHCGDSRMYLMRKGDLVTRTRDHSYSEHLGAGVLTMPNVNRNILMTCLGSYAKPLYDVGGPVNLAPGDRILLCSDGLWGSLDESRIVELTSDANVADAVPSLVEEALRTAGAKSDNVTVIAMEWQSEDEFESTKGVSTDTISDGVFASTIQAGLHSGRLEDLDDLDDEAIERSIAEINEAIRRSGVTKRK
jgi:serine/threonine protein phosphatase PrpC